jgi:hypothetical protein
VINVAGDGSTLLPMHSDTQEINLDEIMERIRAEILLRNGEQAQIQGNIEPSLLESDFASSEKQETGMYRFIKRVQSALQKFPFYHSIYRIARKFKTYIPKYQHQGIPITELLKFEDEVFIKNAYRVILRREPDMVGMDHYLSKLKSNSLSKTEILGRLRYSSEGNRIGSKIEGLSIKHFVSSILRK